MRHFFAKDALITALLAAFLATALAWSGKLFVAEGMLRDFFLRQSALPASNDIVIVAIDEKSILELGAWPWSRHRHAELLQHLSEAQLVYFDILFSEPQSATLTQSHSLQGINTNPDQAFAAAIKQHQNVFLPMHIDVKNYKGQLYEALPLPSFGESAKAIGHIHPAYDFDGIARGIYVYEGVGLPYWPHLSELASQFVNGQPLKMGEQNKNAPLSIQTINRSDKLLLRMVDVGRAYYHIPYIDVYQGLVPPELLKNKQVFIGATAKGLGDDVTTVFGQIPGVVFNASVFDAIQQRAIIDSTLNNTYVGFTFAFTFVACLLLSVLAPWQFAVSTLLLMFSVVAFSAGLFFSVQLWLMPLASAAGIALFYPLWSLQKIRAALVYLRSELNRLQSASIEKVFDLERAKNHLHNLQTIGLIKEASIQPSAKKNKTLFPHIERSGAKSAFVFEHQHIHYEAAFESSLSESQVFRIACDLLGGMPRQKQDSSYALELVHNTLNELNRARALAEITEQRTQKSFAQLQDAVLIVNMVGEIVFVNHKAKGFFADISEGVSVLELENYFQSNLWRELLRSLLFESKDIYAELTTGNGIALLSQATAIKSNLSLEASFTNQREQAAPPVESYFIFVFTDVTELKRLENGKKEALAFLSHDMRSPIVSQLAVIETYRNAHVEMSADQYKLTEQIERYARKNLKFADDFLQLSRAENLKTQAFQLVDAHSLIDGAYAALHGLAKRKGIQLVLSRSEQDCWVDGDHQLLERAIVNLVTNAIEHTPEQGRVELVLTTGAWVKILVRDSGTGIDESMIDNLFEPYFRVKKMGFSNNNQPQKAVSTSNYGLGLSFVKTVVERHGGSVKVSNSTHAGAEFLIRLPVAMLD